jgi:hypothetical protein
MARKGLIRSLPIILLLMILTGPAWAQERPVDRKEQEPVLVGRISHIEGELSRYIPDKQQWVATGEDAPFGFDDSLYSSDQGKAEIIMPNNTWVRIGGSTQIQLFELKTDLTELDVAIGMARFYNKGSDVELKVTTPFGYVMASSDTVFDLYVGDSSVEVIAVKGTVDFIHSNGEAKFEAVEGSSSIIADDREVSAGEVAVEVAWAQWNATRDSLWEQRVQVKGESVEYLPRELHTDSYVLEKHGRWERVSYEGTYRTMWRPVRVSAGWAPFTAGRWVEWHGEQCWMPAEPFGYVTHHYGNWVHVGSTWYWAPPVVSASVHVGAPHFGISFNWYPGRVAWLHRESHVGWVTLAPHETYYSHHYWGPSSAFVSSVSHSSIHIESYRYASHAVIVNQSSFYSVRSYSGVRVRNVSYSTLRNDYRLSTVIGESVIGHHAKSSSKYGFKVVGNGHKFHRANVERIHSNHSRSSERYKYKAKEMRARVNSLEKGKYSEHVKIKSKFQNMSKAEASILSMSR